MFRGLGFSVYTGKAPKLDSSEMRKFLRNGRTVFLLVLKGVGEWIP